MGAVQIVNLVGYRVELFVLHHYEGLSVVGIYSIAMQAAEAMWARSRRGGDRGHGPGGARARGPRRRPDP